MVPGSYMVCKKPVSGYIPLVTQISWLHEGVVTNVNVYVSEPTFRTIRTVTSEGGIFTSSKHDWSALSNAIET